MLMVYKIHHISLSEQGAQVNTMLKEETKTWQHWLT